MLDNNIDITSVWDLADELATVYRNLLVINDAVASGQLKDFAYEVKVEPTKLTVSYKLPKYWKWVEDGRPPSVAHKPPALQPAILQWIRDKGIHANGNVSDEQLSWAITKSIHKKGYSGRPMLYKHLIDGKPVIDKMIELCADAMGQKEIDADLKTCLDGLDKTIKL